MQMLLNIPLHTDVYYRIQVMLLKKLRYDFHQEQNDNYNKIYNAVSQRKCFVPLSILIFVIIY